MGLSVTFSAIRSNAASPSATVTSHRSSQRSSTAPWVTPTTTNGRLARFSTTASPGSANPSCRSTSTAPVRSGGSSLRSSASNASALRGSRIARRYPADVDDPRVERWANSGAMALTGWPDEPLGPPEGLVEGIDRLAVPFPELDALALLGERAALMGLWRRGDTSCGGSCRLLRCADGFMAVSLPRDDDMEMVPAWLELETVPGSAPAVWSAVAAKLAHADPHALIERARLLGLPVARVGEAAESQPRAPVLDA